MAETIDRAQVEPLLECGICLEEYKDPRSLPCLHSFCLECLRSHVSTTKAEDETFQCPHCRRKNSVPGRDVDNFPRNFFVNSLMDIMPASVLQQLQSLSSLASSIPCKNIQDGLYTHGKATSYCEQCDASFCDHCSQSHRLFDALQSHTLIPVHEQPPNCDKHQQSKVRHFCRTCVLPACIQCINEVHTGHDLADIFIVAKEFEQEMGDVSQMAAKRIAILQEMSTEVEDAKTKIKQDFDQASRDISVAADGLCNLIKQHEQTLQTKLQTARETTEKQFTKAKEELESYKENTSSLKRSLDIFGEGSVKLYNMLQAPFIKQQFLQQLNVPIPSVKCHLNRIQVKSDGLLSTGNTVGDVDIKTEVKPVNHVKIAQSNLGPLIHTTKLEYTGKRAVCGIAPIYKTMVCVVHSGEDFIWVYSNLGALQKKIQIPGIDRLTGMIAIDGSRGQIAVVNHHSRSVHFITLSMDLEIMQHDNTVVPMSSSRIGKGCNKQLIINCTSRKRLLVLTTDGEVQSDIEVPIPHTEAIIQCITQTTSGFVICDRQNKKVYFTDVNGHILHTSTDCKQPWRAVHTSWGHVLIADHTGDEVKVFSETGQFLGNVHDNNDIISRPVYIHVDETERLLYVMCAIHVGEVCDHQMRTYKFAPGDLPPLPVKQTATDLTITVKLAKV